MKIRCAPFLYVLTIGILAAFPYHRCAGDEPAGVLKGHKARVISLAMSPDGRTLAATDAAGTLVFWDLDEMATRLVVPQKTTEDEPFPVAIGDVCFSPDGKWLLTTTDYKVRLRDAITGKPIREWPVERTEPLRNWHINEPVFSMEFHPGGRMFACGGGNRGLRGVVFLVETLGQKAPVLMGEQDEEVSHVRFCRDGTRLATGGLGDGISLWNVARRKRQRVLSQEGPIWDLAWAPEGNRLAIAGSDEIRVWDLPPGGKPRSQVIAPATLGISDPERMAILGPLVAFLGNRSRLCVVGGKFVYEPAAVRGSSAFVRIVDVDDATTRELTQGKPWSKADTSPGALEVSQDGKTVAVALWRDIFVWRLDSSNNR